MTLTERRDPSTHQRFAAPAHRQRQRDLHLRGQPAAQAVQGDAADDEAVLGGDARDIRPKAQQEEEEAGSLRRPDRERAVNVAVKTPPDADGQEEATDLPGGRGRQPLAPRRAVHRDPRDLRAAGRAIGDPDRQRPRRCAGSPKGPSRPSGSRSCSRRREPWTSSGPPGRPGRRTMSTDVGDDGANEAVDEFNRVDGGMAKAVLEYLARQHRRRSRRRRSSTWPKAIAAMSSCRCTWRPTTWAR